MRINVLRASLACAAVLSIGIAASAEAQDTTRTTRRVTSQQRIPVQKRESRGDVDVNRLRADSIARADSIERARLEQMRVDSIAAAERLRQEELARIEKMRLDSIAAVEKARADSIAAVERARVDSIARADSIAREEQLRQERMRNRYLFNGSGWYIGVGAGRSNPVDDFKELGYDSGIAVSVPIGWHRPEHLLGIRFDLGFNDFNGLQFSTLSNADPKVFSASVGATLRLPLGSPRFALYGVGGGGMYMFRNYGQNSSLNALLGNDVLDNQDESVETNKTKLGLNGGVGIDLGIGPASIFLESRLVHVFANRDEDFDFDEFFGNRSKHVRWMPLVLGITFR